MPKIAGQSRFAELAPGDLVCDCRSQVARIGLDSCSKINCQRRNFFYEGKFDNQSNSFEALTIRPHQNTDGKVTSHNSSNSLRYQDRMFLNGIKICSFWWERMVHKLISVVREGTRSIGKCKIPKVKICFLCIVLTPTDPFYQVDTAAVRIGIVADCGQHAGQKLMWSHKDKQGSAFRSFRQIGHCDQIVG